MVIEKVLTQTIALFILIFVGYLVKKVGILKDSDIKGISELIVKVTFPMLIITSMARDFSKSKLLFSIIVFIITFITYFLKNIIARFLNKVLKAKDKEADVYRLMILFSNSAFMGFPIIKVLYGDEGLFYAAIINLAFNIFIWTMGISIISGNKNINYKLLLKNPGLISVILGLILFIFPINIPEVINIPLHMIGNVTTPLAMMTIGAMLVDTNILSIFKDKKLIFVSLVRVLLFPIIFMLILYQLPIFSTIAGILLVLESMPVASTVAIFSKKYNSDYELASKGVFLSTLLNIATIPFILYLFSILFKVL